MENYKKIIDELVEKLNNWTKLYDEGNPAVSDSDWDMEYFSLCRLEKEYDYYPSNSPTQRINYEVVNQLNKVKHNHPMLSLAKTKDMEEVESFVGNSLVHIMGKMDGLTCSLRYIDGVLVSAETRGDGEIGEDILHNAKVIANIPNWIPCKDEFIIDGEIICTDKNFEPFKGEYKNSRNFASGSIRLLDSNECAKRNLSFIAWDVIKGFDEFPSLAQKLNYLSDWFDTVPGMVNNSDEVTIAELMDFVKDTCIMCGYPIDGLVIKYDDIKYYESLGRTDHHFKGGIAYKFTDELYETRLKSISWSMGRTGVLTPVAVFEPIDIDGTVVERASLHNLSVMKEVMGDCCWLGQPIKIFKANQIIPQVHSAMKMDYGDVVSKGGITVDGFSGELTCPCCGGGTSIKTSESGVENLICENPQCSGKLINILDHFCGKKGLDIKGLSKKTLEKLIEWGFVSDISDIFLLYQHKTEWIQKEGFGEKSVNNILTAIEDRKNSCELWRFISSLGIPIIGTTYSKQLAEIFESWKTFRDNIGSYNFCEIDGFGDEMHEAITAFDYDLADIIAEMINIEDAEKETKGVSVAGLTFVITGKLSRKRDDIKADIEARGGKVTGSVSGKTNYLVCNDKDSTTGKSAKAKQLGVPVITEDELNELLDI